MFYTLFFAGTQRIAVFAMTDGVHILNVLNVYVLFIISVLIV